MARISTYLTDDDINSNDRLVGSEQYIDSGVIKFRTKNYRVGDLANFFGISVGAVDTYLGAFNSDGSFSYSSAFASQSLSVVATAGYAAATDVTALSATVVTNKSSADASFTSVNQSIATETSARSSAVTSLTASVSLKPNIIRATSEPSITQQVTDSGGNITTTQDPAMGSIWIDITQANYTGGGSNTRPKNEMYVLQGSAGSASWLKTQDTTLLNTQTGLATAEQSLTTVSNAQSATATFATGLASNFGTVNGSTGALTFSEGFANQVLTTTSNTRFAESSFVTNLASTFGSTDPDGNLTINSSFADSVLSTQTSGTLATAQSVTNLTSTVNLKPNIFRQDDAPTSLAIGDIWFDTNDKNKMYVAQGIGDNEVSASEWILTADERLADTISSLATTNQNLTAESNARGALATFTTGLASSFGSADSTTGVLTGYSAGFVDSVMSTNNSAGSSISGINNALESLVVAKPDVFRQTEPPTVTAASGGTPQSPAPGSIWYDTNDNMVPYVLVATTWTKTTDERINDTKVGYLATATENISTISTRSSSTSTKFTNLAADYGSFSGDTFTPGLSSAAGSAVTATVTGSTAFTTAVNTINASLNKVITGSSTPSVTDAAIPTGSIWVNTSNGKSYVLTAGSPKTWVYTANPDFATVTALSSAVAGIDGKLNASYALTVGGGGAIAGMKLLSNGTSSTVSFSSDQFNIYTAGGNVRPFTVSGNAVTMSNVIITGALNGATGSFSGNISGASGSIGGWNIGQNTLDSSNGLLSIDSTNNTITFADSSGPQIEITSSSTVSDPSGAGSSTGMTSNTFSSTPTGGVLEPGQGYASIGSSNHDTSGTYNTSVGSQNGRVITVTATLSGTVITNSTTVSSQASVTYGFQVVNSTTGTVLATSALQTINRTASGSSSASGTFSKNITIPSSFFYIEVRPYIFAASSSNYNGNASLTTTIYYPKTSSVSWVYAPRKIEISQGGLLVAKDSSNFFRVNRNVSSSASWGNNFIHTKMYAWRHEGRLAIVDEFNSSGVGTSGDLMIGQTSPTSSSNGGIRIFTSSGNPYIDYTGGTLQWRNTSSGGGIKIHFQSNGNMLNSNGSYGQISSDERLKKNITDATGKLEDLLLLKVVNYEFISDENPGKKIGFKAQEFEKVFPSLVFNTDTREYDKNNNVISGYEDQKGLYVGMEFAILTKAIQEQQAIIESQKTLIDNLTERVTALEG